MKRKAISVITSITLIMSTLCFSIGYASATDTVTEKNAFDIQENEYKDMFDEGSATVLNENKDNVEMILMNKEDRNWETIISDSDICSQWNDSD